MRARAPLLAATVLLTVSSLRFAAFAGGAEAQARDVPPAAALMVLIRTTLIAVNQANLTGNYSVLRDLGSASFRNSTTAEDLARSLKPFRDQALDLSPVVAVTPVLDRAPAIDERGQLALVGHVPTRPMEITFQLVFQSERATWRPSAIAVGTRTAISEAPVDGKGK